MPKRYFKVGDEEISATFAKSNQECKFSDIVSTRNPYGFSVDLFNNPEKYNFANLTSYPGLNKYKIYGVKGIKGGAKRTTGYVFYNEKNDKDRII